jgi:uncharacterized protein
VTDQHPIPLREYVLKMHTSCNLACDYCYMYELADRSLRGRRDAMTAAVVGRIGERIGAHAREHDLSGVRIIFHGGEPMLVGAQHLAESAALLRAAIGAHVDFVVQTNAVLVDEAALDALAAAGIRVGVSLDGGREANDRHRRFANGRGSFPAVDRALRLLARRPASFAGVLAVIDLQNDPIEVYEAIREYAPPAMDVLLPHHNWQTPPRRTAGVPDEYGRWLARLFDHWWSATGPVVGIRLFEELLVLLMGGASTTESIGLSPVAALVFDVDGTMEQVDTLRSAFAGAAATGLNVFHDPIDTAMRHPGIQARQSGADGLCATCRSCPLHRICGGGYYPHRFDARNGFDNPSVYCEDLKYLIGHVRSRLRADVRDVGALRR